MLQSGKVADLVGKTSPPPVGEENENTDFTGGGGKEASGKKRC